MEPKGEYLYPRIETANLRELKVTQLRRIRRIVKLAYDRSPYYHKNFRSVGIRPEDVRSLADFRKLPILSKDDLRQEIFSRDFTSGITSFPNTSIANATLTSGSTGQNTFSALSRTYLERFLRAVALREYWMAKLRPGMRALVPISGWHFFGLAQNLTLSKMRVNLVSPWGTNFPRFISNFSDTLRETKPDYVIAIPWMLSAIIEELLKNGIEPKKAFKTVKYVSVAGEGLTPRLRDSFIDELGISDLFESGGSVDGMWGGSDCFAHKGHHIWMDANYIEILDPKTGEPVGDGERGSIVSTNLVPGASLFLRFDCQDLGAVYTEECECGRTHNRVEIFDRISNVVKISGKSISSFDLIQCFESLGETRRSNFTIIKYSDAMDRLKIKAALDFPVKDEDEIATRLRDEIRGKLGVDAEIEWVSIDRLPIVGRKLKRVLETDIDNWDIRSS